MAMSWIRSVVRRALIAPKPRGSRQFTVTAAGGGATQTEMVAAEMVRYALGGAVHRSSPGSPFAPSICASVH
jgi:hypothetical protein